MWFLMFRTQESTQEEHMPFSLTVISGLKFCYVFEIHKRLIWEASCTEKGYDVDLKDEYASFIDPIHVRLLCCCNCEGCYSYHSLFWYIEYVFYTPSISSCPYNYVAHKDCVFNTYPGHV